MKPDFVIAAQLLLGGNRPAWLTHEGFHVIARKDGKGVRLYRLAGQ